MGIENPTENFFKKYFCHEWRPFWPTNVSKSCSTPKPIPLDPKEIPPKVLKKFKPIPAIDPRFQQTNQTLRCYVMYTDFYRCQKILGKNHKACEWFKDAFQAFCPNEWIEKFEYRRTHVPPIFPWHKYKSQGDFPGHCYGDDRMDYNVHFQ